MRKEGWRIVHCHLLVIHGEAEKNAAKDVLAASNGCSSTSLQEHDCSGACDDMDHCQYDHGYKLGRRTARPRLMELYWK